MTDIHFQAMPIALTRVTAGLDVGHVILPVRVRGILAPEIGALFAAQRVEELIAYCFGRNPACAAIRQQSVKLLVHISREFVLHELGHVFERLAFKTNIRVRRSARHFDFREIYHPGIIQHVVFKCKLHNHRR